MSAGVAGLVAAACAGGAAALWLPVGPAIGGRAPRGGVRTAYVLGSGGALAGVVAAGSPRTATLVLIVVATAAAALRLVRRQRADRAARAVRGRVVELCGTLHAELAAGQPPAAALERAVGDWPLLAPVVRTAAAGGDVPTALRALTAVPGAGDLRVVAAAWQVAHRTGHGLGETVARVEQELREAEQTRRVVAGELASARATARLVAVLPVLALAMGSGAGADPWSFLVGTPLGLGCLAGGLGFVLAGLTWIEALARDVERGR